MCIGNLLKSDGHTGNGARIFARQFSEAASASAPPLYFVSSFSHKPVKLSFWYKSTKNLIGVIALSKGDPLADDPTFAGIGQITAGPSIEFTRVEVPIKYNDQITYDSIAISFRFANQLLTSDDYFIMDDLELGYDLASITSKRMREIVNSNIVTSSLNLNETVDEITILNTSGTEILNQHNTQSVDFSKLPEGFHIIMIKTENAVGKMKVIKI